MKSRTPNRFRKLQLIATVGGDLESILTRVETPNLIWLRWNNCPYSFLPSWIPMKNIRILELDGNKLKTLWRAESQVNAASVFIFFALFYGRLLLLLHTSTGCRMRLIDCVDDSESYMFIFIIVDR